VAVVDHFDEIVEVAVAYSHKLEMHGVLVAAEPSYRFQIVTLSLFLRLK
jgi:hypothetical protein